MNELNPGFWIGWGIALVVVTVAYVINYYRHRMPRDLARVFYCESHEWEVYNSTMNRCRKCGGFKEAGR